MKQIKVILNPFSGRGRANRARMRITQALEQVGLAVDLVETAAPGHGIELAHQAQLDGYEIVAAAGGDGTVSEVVNGLAQATPAGEQVGMLAVFPLGSGNDFAEMAGCPRDFHKVAQAIAVTSTRPIDLGLATIQTAGQTTARYFDNNMGVGFEAQVTLESYKIRRLRGTLLYVVAALRALRHYASPHMEIVWHPEEGEAQVRSHPTLLVSIGNSPRTGGGFYLTPDASLDDGLLDAGIAQTSSLWQVLQLLPKALQGKHVNDPAVTMLRTSQLQIASEDRLPVQLDGEVISTNADIVKVEIQPRRLTLIV